MNKKANKNKMNTHKKIAILVTALVVVIAISAGVVVFKLKSNAASASDSNVSADGSLVIPIDKVTSDAGFYKYDAEGTKLEVIAIKATDGTIRTAFNTCQVCYSSGKGYYKQQGDTLVCQNCGNRFKPDQVEVTKGGCNPVPIFDENKTVDAQNITISKDYLIKAKKIFANWKDS